MKRLILTIVFCLAGAAVYAAGPDLIWAGGGLKLSNESNPCYYADTFVSFGHVDTMAMFAQPMLTLKGGDLGFDLGGGGRLPMLNATVLAGYNFFFDYTSNHSHKRLSTGLEVYHPYFSSHMNLYLPLSNENDGQEALPGLDLSFGIPMPQASFITVWPGFYYYNGRDRDDMGGMSMMIQVQPIRPLYISLGGRNDALQAGRGRSELFFKVEFAVPLNRLGKDLFKINWGEYPLDVKSQMDHRVVREEFITYEIKRR